MSLAARNSKFVAWNCAASQTVNTTAAIVAVKQISTVTFNADTAPRQGYTYSVTINSGTARTYTASATDGWSQVLTGLSTGLASDVDVVIDAANRKLTLTAKTAGTAFTVSAMSVKHATAGDWAALGAVLEGQIERLDGVATGFTVDSSVSQQLVIDKGVGAGQTFSLSNVMVTDHASAEKAGYYTNKHVFSTPTVAASGTLAQVSEIQFLGNLNPSATYAVMLDGKLFEVPAATLPTWNDVLGALKAQIDSSVTQTTVGETTTSVNDGYVATVMQTGGQNALQISKGTNQLFALNSVSVGATNLATKATTTEAGESRFEEHQLRFDAVTVPVVEGQRYYLTINSTAFMVTAAAGDDIVAVLGKLRTAVNADAALAVTALAADAAQPTLLTLKADVINTAFTVSGAQVMSDVLTVSPNMISNQLQTAAVTAVAQQNAVQFTGTPSAGYSYKVTERNAAKSSCQGDVASAYSEGIDHHQIVGTRCLALPRRQGDVVAWGRKK